MNSSKLNILSLFVSISTLNAHYHICRNCVNQKAVQFVDVTRKTSRRTGLKLIKLSVNKKIRKFGLNKETKCLENGSGMLKILKMTKGNILMFIPTSNLSQGTTVRTSGS